MATDILAITATATEFLAATLHLSASREGTRAWSDLVDRTGRSWLIELVLINGMGSVHSALVTQDALRRTGAPFVVLMGLAAGVPGRVAVGDVVIPEQVVYYESQKVVDAAVQSAPAWRTTDAGLRGLASVYLPTMAELTIHTDTVMACGEKVVAAAAFRDVISSMHRRLAAFDMESFGVACAAERQKVRFSVIKGISDFADSTKNDAHRERAVAASCAALRRLLHDCAFV